MKLININKYEAVKSTYRSQWSGIIITKQKRNGYGKLLTILVVLDKNGRLMRKRKIVFFDERWTINISNMNIDINEDWLKPNTNSDFLYQQRIIIMHYQSLP